MSRGCPGEQEEPASPGDWLRGPATLTESLESVDEESQARFSAEADAALAVCPNDAGCIDAEIRASQSVTSAASDTHLSLSLAAPLERKEAVVTRRGSGAASCFT